MKCKCQEPEPYYYLSCNENGWKCLNCKTELGFSPDLDREYIDRKVDGILHDLVHGNFLYISNNSEGSFIVAKVCDRCFELEKFDQLTIFQEILQHIQPRFSSYWKDKSLTAKDLEKQ